MTEHRADTLAAVQARLSASASKDGPLIRYGAHDDPDDDSPRERAERRAQTRFKRNLDRARTPEAVTAAIDRLSADLDRARALPDQ